MKYLIVNADDFCYSPEVSEGVLKAFTDGIVTDTSVFICSPYAEAAITKANEVGLPVGIHIDLVTEFVAKTHRSDPDLIGPDGVLARELYQREFNHHINHLYTSSELITLRNEIRRQIDIFIKLTGEKPSHLDYHFGLHHLPDLMAIYVTIAEEYRIPIRWGSQYAGKNPYDASPKVFCDEIRGTPQSDKEDILKLVEKPWIGVMEICCHPGFYSPNGLPDSYNIEREYELAVLTDPELKVELTRRKIQLVNYHWLTRKQNSNY
jgi:predicted glycoside hydrolase/deacetylase ChbG (UPF0249 family)